MRRTRCEDRIDLELQSRLDDLKSMLAGDHEGLADYGLCFDFVAPETFDEQLEGYFRYQISWGGPSDEFRFFVNPDLTCHRVEYWFMDWFDGARRTLENEQREVALRLLGWLGETGAVTADMRA